MAESIVWALVGGAVIGFASSLMLVFNGRVTGISGIANGFLSYVKGDRAWRGAFLLGLILGGAAMNAYSSDFFTSSDRPLAVVIFAGVVVGFGTVLGSGCTSGHGVCGISRFSIRSLIATVLFMAVGMVTATVFKNLLGV